MAQSDQSSCQCSHALPMRRAAGHGTGTEPGQSQECPHPMAPMGCSCLESPWKHWGDSGIRLLPLSWLLGSMLTQGLRRKNCLTAQETPWQGTAADPGKANPWDRQQDFQPAGIPTPSRNQGSQPSHCFTVTSQGDLEGAFNHSCKRLLVFCCIKESLGCCT